MLGNKLNFASYKLKINGENMAIDFEAIRAKLNKLSGNNRSRM